MRMLSLKSFRLFQPLRLITPTRKFKMRSLYRQSFNTPKYLKISLPLSLFALTYAFSTFSAKANEQSHASKGLFDQFSTDQNSEQDKALMKQIEDKLNMEEQQFEKSLQILSERFILLQARRKVKDNEKLDQSKQKEKALKARFNAMIKIVQERSNLSEIFQKDNVESQKQEEALEKLMRYSSQISFLMSQMIQDSEVIIDELTDSKIYDERVLQAKIQAELNKMQKEIDS